MTHRERLLAAVSHRQPDRVPIDLGGRETPVVGEAYEAESISGSRRKQALRFNSCGWWM